MTNTGLYVEIFIYLLKKYIYDYESNGKISTGIAIVERTIILPYFLVPDNL